MILCSKGVDMMNAKQINALNHKHTKDMYCSHCRIDYHNSSNTTCPICGKKLYEKSSVPRCPTCQSDNIVKISAAKRVTHGAAFGLLSKTAFSQFECKNCGYRW